ncbi:MAG: hypothetical protein HY922_06070 [Elusimicrobia bacterium]|nr:hypothetical protein [Elusimicrobiota bacterium]
MVMGYLATLFLATFSSAYAGDDVFQIVPLNEDGNRPPQMEVRKRAGGGGYYELANFHDEKDTTGKKHTVCSSVGLSIVDKQELIQRLALSFGFRFEGDPSGWPADVQRKISDHIKQVDAGKLGFRQCKTPPPEKKTVQVEPLHLQEGRLYDQNDNEVGALGGPIGDFRELLHYYKLNYCKTMKDIQGEQFLAIDHTDIVSNEELQTKQSALERKIASPLTDSNSLNELKKELSSTRLYLDKITNLELKPTEDKGTSESPTGKRGTSTESNQLAP